MLHSIFGYFVVKEDDQNQFWSLDDGWVDFLDADIYVHGDGYDYFAECHIKGGLNVPITDVIMLKACELIKASSVCIDTPAKSKLVARNLGCTLDHLQRLIARFSSIWDACLAARAEEEEDGTADA